MKNKRKFIQLVILGLLLARPYCVYADAEYDGIGTNVLDIINAQDAYNKGYTGSGVTVGVTDAGPINFNHPEFNGKQNSSVVEDPLNINSNWNKFSHPTHVGGIVAANKDGVGMHGVAYNADIASSSVAREIFSNGHFYSSMTFYDYYLTDPDVKVINNSWGSSIYLSEVKDEEYFKSLLEYFNGRGEEWDVRYQALKQDKLLVFSAANDGHLTAAIDNMIDVLSDSDVNTGSDSKTYADYKIFNDNIITVTAANAGSLSKGANGAITAKSDAIAIFSDLAMFNEDSALSEPGWKIKSTYSDYAAAGNLYVNYYGTSMAAPVVTGVAALVQEAFPYLSGKQIGDVLLSTANNNITANDGYFVTLQEDGTVRTFNILYTGSKSVDDESIKEDLIKSIKEDLINYFKNGNNTIADWFFGGDVKKYEAWKQKSDDELLEQIKKLSNREDGKFYKVYQNVPMEILFGQGIVDAGKAVNGLGAINVRRLNSSDISSDYTVAETGEKKQALYKVDTQGYDSVWSNDISEIRAGYIAANPLDLEDGAQYVEDNEIFDGLTDLHDRWVFYTTNVFTEDTKDGNNYMVKKYVDHYNKMMAETGLIGLHAGLYKTGEGILALTGDNTYKGASIAAGGTLQIDGSVAGDAYSEGSGTIAGSGIITHNLYNNGRVVAGSWGSVTDDDGDPLALNVKGDLSGSGVIGVNTDGNNYTKIEVVGKADVSGMSVKADTFAAPDKSGTILTAQNGLVTDADSGTSTNLKRTASTSTLNKNTGGNSLSGEFSGLLNAVVTRNRNNLNLTTKESNNAGISAARYKALTGLYDNLNAEEQKEMYRLYALDSSELKAEMNTLSKSEGMHLDMAHDAMRNRDIRHAVQSQQQLERDEELWAISAKSWGEHDNGLSRHSFNLTIGRDLYSKEESYMGAMFAYSDNSIGGFNADGEYKNYSLGLYGGTRNKPGTVTGYISYGVQDNEMERTLGSSYSHSGTASRINSSYDSSVIGAGIKYAYDLDYGKEEIWHISPYGAVDYAHYKQDSFSESGSVYSVHSGGFSDNYLTGELGLEFKREDDNGQYGLSLAYRRILAGDEQETGFSFVNGSSGFKSVSSGESKNHIVAGGYISTMLSDKWEIGGSIEHDWSSDSRDLSAALNLNYYF